MFEPITADLTDVVNRYGALGLPLVAAAMRLVSAAMESDLDPAALAVFHAALDLSVCEHHKIVVDGDGQVRGADNGQG